MRVNNTCLHALAYLIMMAVIALLTATSFFALLPGIPSRPLAIASSSWTRIDSHWSYECPEGGGAWLNISRTSHGHAPCKMRFVF